VTANRLERAAEREATRTGRWLDTRLGLAHFLDSVLNHVFPDNWSFMLGEVAMYCFVILVITGTYLTFFFHPSSADVVYHGRYVPLQGLHMSDAYSSTLQLSFDVRAGLVVRQIHHWSADLFAAALILHLCRIFFTGAFRRPREINWIIGLTMFILVIVNGFAGYSLPDDLLSATGLRIAYSVVISIPVIGTWLASLFFGGTYPGTATTGRLYIIHVLLLPGLIAVLLGAHLAIIWRQKHTQYPGPGRTERNVVGSRLWPTYTAKSIGLFAAVFAVVAALGGLAQINPIWLYGPNRTGAVSTAAQPDWYMGWLEGALRTFPPWRIHVFHHTIPELFLPAVVLPGLTFGLLYLWPFIEAKVSGDHRDHELLDRPHRRPIRTAIGMGVLTFYIVLFVAGSQDIVAQHLHAEITEVNRWFRILLFVLPVLVAVIAWKWCHDLIGRDKQEEEDQRFEDPEARGSEEPPEPARTDEPEHPSRLARRAGKTVGLAAAIAFALRRRRRAKSGSKSGSK
jgi:ubiquinol-cytochrome c reductase cytochrome b subunit